MAVGAELTRYRVLSRLGAGGMATVSLAEDTLLGRPVALKRVITAEDLRGLSRLRREALLGASVSHPNLVSIYDVVASEEEDDLVIVMEYVRGDTLRTALRREGRLAHTDALRILEGIAAGLDTLHQHGIVHRDIKPSNILLGDDGAVKIADLGIASMPERTRITTAGSVLGSLSYMAPEQLSDGPSTPAIDVYALSAVAFEVLSGRKARRESNPVALAHAISTLPPPDVRDAWPDAPPAVADLLVRGMARDPHARPSSAGELTGRLREALEPEVTAPLAGPAPAEPVIGRAERPRMATPSLLGPAGPAAGAAPTTETMRTSGSAKPAPADAPESIQSTSPERPQIGPGSKRREGVLDGSPVPDRRAGSRRAVATSATGRDRSSSRLVAGGLLAAVVIAVAVAVFQSAGGSQPHTRAAAVTHRHQTGTGSRSTGKSTAAAGTQRTTAASPVAASHSSSASASATGSASSSTSGTTTGSGSPPPQSASSGPASPAPVSTSGAAGPVSAVESFYSLAASHHYSDAWALADPAFQGQLGGYRSFEAGQAGDRSLSFDSARTISNSSTAATVLVSTTSVRDDGTHHCTGTVELRAAGSGGRWLLHLIHINCT